MFTYVPTPNSVPMFIYIPTGSGNSAPYDGPLWVAVLLLGALYITLLFACYKLYVDLIKQGTCIEDKVEYAEHAWGDLLDDVLNEEDIND